MRVQDSSTAYCAMMGVATVACMLGHLSHLPGKAAAALAQGKPGPDWPSHTLPFMAVYLVMVGVHSLFMLLTDPQVRCNVIYTCGTVCITGHDVLYAQHVHDA